MKKRIISILLAVLLVLPFSLLTISAEGTPYKLNVTGNATDYVGESYTYVINVGDIDGSNGGLNFLQFTLVYPKEYLEYVKGSAAFTGGSGWTYSYTSDPEDRIIFTATGVSGNAATTSGDIQFTVVFKAKAVGTGSLEFTAIEATQLTLGSTKFIGASTPLAISVVKQSQAKPSAPELASKTSSIVVLKSYTGYEYSKDGTTWSDSNSFTGLDANKEYTFYQRIKETDTKFASPASDGLKVTTDKMAGSSVGIPEIESKTDKTITVKAVTGCEYSIDNGLNWQPSNTFTGLSPSTKYYIVQRQKETSTTSAGATSAVLEVTTEKEDGPEAPGKPILHSVTPNMIILTLVTGCEYTKDGGVTWQDSNTFTGLDSNKSYTFNQRYKETSTRKASAISLSSTFKTTKNAGPAAPSAPTQQSVTPTSITLTATEGYEYSIDEGATWQPSNVFTNLNPNTQYYFVQRVAETNDTQASEKSTKTAISTIKYTNSTTPVDPVVSAKTDKTISLVNISGYEYSIDNGVTYQPSPNFTGLNPYTDYSIKQRIAETDDTYVSVSSNTVVVKTNKTPTNAPGEPTVQSKTATTITLVIVPGCEYSRDNVTYTENNVFEGLSPNTEYVIYQRVKETDTTAASNPSYASIKTLKSDNTVIPNAPELTSKTATTITLKAVTGYEYKMGDGEWQTSNVFSGLTPNTQYSFYQRIAETTSTFASVSSSALTVTTGKYSGSSSITEPVVKTITATTIELVSVDGYEYRVGDGDKWQDSPLFTGLTPNTQYNFTQRIKETTSTYASAVSGMLSVKTNKQSAPQTVLDPVLSSKTSTSITLVEVTGYVYSINNGTSWQPSPVFTGLNPNTSYTFVQKIEETDTTYGSAVSNALDVTTNKNSMASVPANPVIKDVTDVSISVVTEAGVEYSINNGTAWNTTGVFTGLNADTTYTIISRYAETNTTYASDANTGTQQKTKKTAPSAPGAPTVQVTNNTATITPTPGYEYSKDGETWQSSNQFTGLFPNTPYTFYQRVAGTDDTSPSQPSQGTSATTSKNPAPSTPSAPTLASKTGTTITINAITGYEYSINDGSTWQTSNVFTDLTPVTNYQIVQRVKETNTTLASAKSQPLNVTTGKAANSIVPNAPEIESATTTTITVVAISNYEYSMNKTTWQSSNVFTGLISGKTYTIYQRIAETATTLASQSSVGTIASTVTVIRPATPDSPTLLDLTATSVYLLFIPGYEYSLGGNTWQRSIAFEGLTPETTYTFYQRVAATSTSLESLTSSPLVVRTLKTNPKPVGPEEVKAPIVSMIEPTAIYLIGFGGYEYSCDGGKTFQSSNVFVGLTPNTEYTIVQRIAKTNTTAASKLSDYLVIKTLKADQNKPDKPVIESVDGTTITIKKVDNVEYSCDGGSIWQSSNVFSGLQVNVVYTFVVRYKGNDTQFPSEASDPVQYMIESQHKHENTKVETIDPTCETNGVKKVVCVDCGEVLSEEILPATGHNYSWVQTKAATCQEEGSENLVCSKCGKVSETRAIPKTEHKLSDWEKVDDENEGRKCSDCGKVIEVRLIQKETTETTNNPGTTGKVTPGLLIFIIILIVLLLLIIAFVVWYIIKEKQKKQQAEQ